MCRHLLRYLAPTLVAAGNMDDAVAFEGLVHRLAQEQRAAVICAYPIHAFVRRADLHTVLRLSAQHDRLEFPDRLWLQEQLAAATPGARV